MTTLGGRRRPGRPLRRGAGPHREARRAALPRGPDGPVDARRLARRSGTAPTSPGSSRRSCSPTTSPASRPSRTTYWFLFNSYYEARRPALPRAERGLITRPGAHEVGALPRQRRRPRCATSSTALDGGTLEKLAADRRARLPPRAAAPGAAAHGHQARAVASTRSSRRTPARPSRRRDPGPARAGSTSRAASSRSATAGDGFRFDNELPRHRVWLEPYRLADRLVTNGEWLEFMADGGYERHELWLSDGWAQGQRRGLARAVLLGASSTACGSSTRCSGTWPVDPGAAGEPRQLLRGRGLRHAGPASGCRPRPSGSTPSSPTGGDAPTARQPRRRRDASTRAPAGAAPRRRLRQVLRRLLGVDVVGLPPLPRVPPGRRRDRRVQRQVHVRPDGAARRLRVHPARPRARDLPQLLPAAVAVGAVRRPPRRRGGSRVDDRREPVVSVAARARTGPAPRLVAGRPPRARLASRGRLPPKWLYDDEGSRALRRDHPPARSTTRPRPSARSCATTPPTSRARATRPRSSSSAAARATRPAPLLDAFADAGQLARFVPVDVSEATLRDAAEQIADALPRRRRSRRSSATSPCTSATCRATAAGWSPSSAARSATSTSRSARAFLGALADILRARRLAAARHRPGQGGRPADRGLRRPARRHRRGSSRNCLRVLNRELGADFDLDAFSYVPFWDPRMERMDLRLRAEMPQHVTHPGRRPRRSTWRSGEEIRIEISTKFRPEGIRAELLAAGFVARPRSFTARLAAA